MPEQKPPQQHEWFQYHNLTCCRRCGIVRRADGKNKPCKGPVKISLRDNPADRRKEKL